MTAADLDWAVIEQARRIAEEEIGGPPPRCTGPLADRYNAAFNAVVKALAGPVSGTERPAARAPSQRLDAATVERLRAALKYARNLIGPDEIIDAALATEPHQHGGGSDA